MPLLLGSFKLRRSQYLGPPVNRVALTTLVMVVALLLGACAHAPLTGRPQLMLISQQQADQMGTQAFQQLLAKAKVSHDPVYVDQVTRVGTRIAAVAGHPEYHWQFAVIDDPKQINAFALPGGKVAVYTGLLALHLSDAELAAVLGHEIGHVVAQHSRERVSEALVTNLGLQALGSTTQLSPNSMKLVNLALGVGVGLPFSRAQESEADMIGLELMAKAGYDPHAALALWARLSQMDQGQQPPALLSDHPSDQQRIAAIRQAIPRFMPLYEANRNRFGAGG